MLRTFLIGLILGGLVTAGWWYLREKPTHESTINTYTSFENSEKSNVAVSQSTEKKEIQESIYESRRNAITKAVEIASPAVVGVNVIQVRERIINRNPFFNDPFFSEFFPPEIIRQRIESIGSGFIISEDGYILTCDHVVENATEILVTLYGGKQEKAEVVGTDRVSDIALLKIDGKNFPYLELDRDPPIVGEWVIAMGNPFGLFNNNVKPSVSVGVVSTTGQDFERNREGRIYRDMIQTDAAINSGNSGGPLLNSLGKVIGMNTMIYTPVQNLQGVGPSAGVGFAIPSYRLISTVNVLKKGKSLNRDFYTGLRVQNLDLQLARSLGLKSAKGIIVVDVERGSPAAKAGVKTADVILALDDYEIEDVPSLRRALDRLDLKVGDIIRLKILRDGKQLNVQLRLEAYKR
ncbi:MAG: trypsin-like peptidase domain-containing protein [bacterium]|nr:trypsin-like peptidase domain-containing protein [bacterium]